MSNADELAREIQESGLFDEDWYVSQYPDVGMVGLPPLMHFVRFGLMLGRNPGPEFDSDYYLDANPDVVAANMDAFMHFMRHGKIEGRRGCRPIPKRDRTVDTARAAPTNVAWTLRIATAPSALRGLEPQAKLAVIANCPTSDHGKAVSGAIGRVAEPFDLFLLGDLDKLDTSALPTMVKTLTLLSGHDEKGKANGFCRLAGSGALDHYVSALWLSPQDVAAGSAQDEMNRTIAMGPAFAADANWACASTSIGRCDRNFADVTIVLNMLGGIFARSRDTALSRSGIEIVKQGIPIPNGPAIWLKPLLARILTAAQAVAPAIEGGEALLGSRPALTALLAAAGVEGGMRTTAKAVALPAIPAERGVKTIAFYLPQFHPIPENDRWWGKGFTEWSNVARARPWFRHHDQPRMPTDLGYYDLRLEDTQVAQARMARAAGIHGFCYHYYWFNGRKLLNQPIEQMLRSSRIDIGFCICWANENWSRNWDGQNEDVLLEQDYSPESKLAFIRDVIPMMQDRRWIRYEGKPVLVVYRIAAIPDWKATARMWREECRKAGLGDIHLCAVRFDLDRMKGSPQDHGVDSFVLFPPHESTLSDLRATATDVDAAFSGEIYSYQAVVDGDIERHAKGYEWPVHRGAMLAWDNSARRQSHARVFQGANPFGFRKWIKAIVEQDIQYNTGPETMLFVNAWNEWAEGSYLEPDQRWGMANLLALRSAIDSVPGVRANLLPEGTVGAVATAGRLAHLGSPLTQDGDMPAAPVWHEGERAPDPDRLTILLCGHISGHQLFGGERSLIDVLEAFASIPVNVIVTLPSDNNPGYLNQIRRLSTGLYSFSYPQTSGGRENFAWLTLDFADIIARHAVDIVHANTIVLMEPVVAAKAMDRTTVIHVRELIALDDDLRTDMALTTRQIVEAVLNRGDWLIGNSQASCDQFNRSDRTLLVPNAVSAEQLDMPNPISGEIRFGILSSNIPRKGIADFAEVARRAASRSPRAKFIIMGPTRPEIDQWLGEIAHGERPDNLIFLGYKDDARAAMQEINVLLNLSTFGESFGRTVAEALAAGRPVIAYRWGALPELVQDGETGILAPFRDIDAVVDAVVQLCDREDMIGSMGQRGRAYVAARFSQDGLRRKLAEAYAKISNRPMDTDADVAASGSTAARSIGAARPVSIVIPVYNAPDQVRACLTSVIRHTNLQETQVIVIDDGSSAPEITPLLAQFEGVAGLRILRSSENRGYTHSVNRGMGEAGDRDVILLNSDTIVTPRWLEGLRAAAYSRPSVGTVTAMSDNAGAFSFPSFGQKCEKPAHLSHDEYALLLVQQTFDCPPPVVPTGSGFCLYVRREMLNDCGLFDADGFPQGYGEENDLCLRAAKSGWLHLVSPWSFVFHERSASFGDRRGELVESGVAEVIRRYPDYPRLVDTAFAAPAMATLRHASAIAASIRP